MEVVKDRRDCGSGSSNKVDKMNISLCAWTLHDNLKPWLKGMLLNWFFLFFFFLSQLIDQPSSQQKGFVIQGKLPLFDFYLLSFTGMFWRSSWPLACRKFAFSAVIGEPKRWQKTVVCEMALLISDTAYPLAESFRVGNNRNKISGGKWKKYCIKTCFSC